MANPTINSVTASQISTTNNPGGVNRPSVKVLVNLTHPSTMTITADISTDGGSTWKPATLMSPGNGTSVASGTGVDRLVVVDLLTTFSNASLAPYTGSTFKVRVKVETATTPSENATATSSAIAVNMTAPTITSVTAPSYVGADGVAALTITQSGGTMYRAGLTNLVVVHGGSALMSTISGGSPAFVFGSLAANPDGNYTIYVAAYDDYYNQSVVASTSTYLLRTPPQDCKVVITGLNGNMSYTGIEINSDGTFTPNRSASIRVSGTSSRPLQYRILPTSNCDNIVSINSSTVDVVDGTYFNLTAPNATPQVMLITGTATQVHNGTHVPANDNFNVDTQVFVTVEFKDAAGNTTYATGSIILNTRIYKVEHAPMQPADASYRPMIKQVAAGVESVIPESVLLSNDPIRRWPDIFYPPTHGYPADYNGLIDAAAAVTITAATPEYDPVVTGDAIVRDEDGRPITTSWTKDGTKNYQNMLSSSTSNMVYWVIDNTGYGDFSLEFEFFDLHSTIYGPPYNPIAPHEGDVLAVFDASADGALSLEVDDNGVPRWRLTDDPTADSSLLVEIAAYTGSGPNVRDIISGRRVNSGQNGQFTSEPFRGVSRLVLVLYTDASGTASGFKLKAGRKHDRVWSNYDIDYKNGEVWIHQYAGEHLVNGMAQDTTKRIIYNYFDEEVEIDFEAGEVIFSSAKSNVTADFSYYKSDTYGSRFFLASQDDFVYYQEAFAYIAPSGASHIVPGGKSRVFEIDGDGRITTHHSWDKDRGILAFDEGHIPHGRRIFADYRHHTYKRLTSDGFGDLTFRDPILVADDTPAFPDFTFSDVKIVNEGDALLEDWKVVFVARGYNTDGNLGTGVSGDDTVVDQVLDINRPWDVQKGTRQETYERMAMEIASNYLFSAAPTKQVAGTTLGTWRDKAVPFDLAARGRCFGRAVWVLGGSSGSDYPDTTPGVKRTSLEVEGKYYATTIP